jgi:hypothetical protein
MDQQLAAHQRRLDQLSQIAALEQTRIKSHHAECVAKAKTDSDRVICFEAAEAELTRSEMESDADFAREQKIWDDIAATAPR